MSEAELLVGAVREDIRQTLRVAWVHPGIEVAADHPVFLAAAWSAIRPNVGKTFDVLTQTLGGVAVESLRPMGPVPNLRASLGQLRSAPEVRRMVETAVAAQFDAARNEVAVHLLSCAARGQSVGGTGAEEPPARRGIPERRRWMAVARDPVAAGELLGQAERVLDSPSAPPVLRLLARWPEALEATWKHLRPVATSDAWRRSTVRLRWAVRAGVGRLPHPVAVQWRALRRRGFSEEDQAELRRVLAAHDRAMPANTLTAAFVWLAFGEPDGV
jgi:hypothetical protein